MVYCPGGTTFPVPGIGPFSYQSLIVPYITYGLSVWGQACKSYQHKILLLQKRALRFMYFAKINEHTVPLFINANLLPLNFLYYKTLSELMYDVRNASAHLTYAIYLHIRPASTYTTLVSLPQTIFT